MDNPLKHIQEASESKRRKMAYIIAAIIFILIVVIFVATGAGFGKFKNTQAETAVTENGKTKTLFEALYEFSSLVRAGFGNLKESVSDVIATFENQAVNEQLSTTTENIAVPEISVSSTPTSIEAIPTTTY